MSSGLELHYVKISSFEVLSNHFIGYSIGFQPKNTKLLSFEMAIIMNTECPCLMRLLVLVKICISQNSH